MVSNTVADVYAGVLVGGRHSIQWQGRTSAGVALQTGRYFARLSTATGTQTIDLVQAGP